MSQISLLTAPIVVVGAGGFIGRALSRRLAEHGATVIAVMRRPADLPVSVAQKIIGDLSPATDWTPLFPGAGAVIHLASRAHAPLPGNDPHWIAREVETARTLATAARDAKVDRVIFCSSIKAMGETSDDGPFRADQPPHPGDAYGEAKLAVEEAMREIVPKLIVLRPPLVYGPEVKANFRTLIRWVDRGLPLPFASVANRRSFVFIENLIDLLESALVHPEAPGETFLMRDANEISTPDLIRAIARALGRKPRLWPCPPSLLRTAARWAGRGEMAERLIASLEIDDRPTRKKLGWYPRFSVEEGLSATCAWYRRENGSAPDDSSL